MYLASLSAPFNVLLYFTACPLLSIFTTWPYQSASRIDQIKYVEGAYANMWNSMIKMSTAFTWQDVCQIHKIQTKKKKNQAVAEMQLNISYFNNREKQRKKI